MRFRHRHRARNIAIGSIIAAVSAGAAIYVIYKVVSSKNKEKQEENNIPADEEKLVESANDVLVSKIGASKSQVEEAKMLHRTAYDLAKEKGFSEEQLKMFINQERVRPIDELILNRKITSGVGHQVKEKIIEHTNSWDGSLF
jgi:hypothetical protein